MVILLKLVNFVEKISANNIQQKKDRILKIKLLRVITEYVIFAMKNIVYFN